MYQMEYASIAIHFKNNFFLHNRDGSVSLDDHEFI